MLSKLSCLSRSSWYWLGLIILGLSMEGVALFFQYGLNYGPCVLCIHIRIWVMAFTLVAILGFCVRKSLWGAKLSHLLMLLASLGLTERSWQTLAVERGWVIDSCSMNSGLPNWFALDQWFPLLFEPWEPCGYTPELLFNITMAEALMLFSISLLCISIVLNAINLRSK